VQLTNETILKSDQYINKNFFGTGYLTGSRSNFVTGQTFPVIGQISDPYRAGYLTGHDLSPP